MTMMCRDIQKGKEKVHVEVELYSDGSDYMVVSDDEASNDINQPSTSYTKRSRHIEVDSSYGLTRDKVRRVFKTT